MWSSNGVCLKVKEATTKYFQIRLSLNLLNFKTNAYGCYKMSFSVNICLNDSTFQRLIRQMIETFRRFKKKSLAHEEVDVSRTLLEQQKTVSLKNF